MTKSSKLQQAKSDQDPLLEELEIGNVIYQTRLTSKYRNRKPWERPDERILRAVIPGTIQKIMVAEEDEVKMGEPLLILEAMKMKNEILAPFQGVIKKLNVSVGEQVPKHHILVEFK